MTNIDYSVRFGGAERALAAAVAVAKTMMMTMAMMTSMNMEG